jgi:hypothetical protein
MFIKKMNKKILKQLEKTIIPAMISLVLAASLFAFSSCKSDYRKTLDGDAGTISSVSSTSTADGTNTNTTGEAANQEKETAAATSGNGAGTTATAETTAQTADPAAQQIIEVTASGGYSPRKIDAKAGVPTILVMKSEGAYGCERAFNIPDLKISEILPENGQTQFDLGTQAKGTKLLGVCSMGMYSFQIFFN